MHRDGLRIITCTREETISVWREHEWLLWCWGRVPRKGTYFDTGFPPVLWFRSHCRSCSCGPLDGNVISWVSQARGGPQFVQASNAGEGAWRRSQRACSHSPAGWFGVWRYRSCKGMCRRAGWLRSAGSVKTS